MNMNKKELEELIKKLKEEVRTLRQENAELNKSASSVDLKHNGMSVILNERNEYKLVKLKFDTETGLGKVVELKDLTKNNKDYALAEYYGVQYFIEKIMQPLSE